MGISTLTAARIFEGQKRGEGGEENRLSFEEFPFFGSLEDIQYKSANIGFGADYERDHFRRQDRRRDSFRQSKCGSRRLQNGSGE